MGYWLNGKEHVLENSKEWVTSQYGYRTDPVTGKASAYHGGIDLVDGKSWLPVDILAFASGTVSTAVDNVSWSYAATKSLAGISSSLYHGNHIIVAHEGGYTTTYKHLKLGSTKVKVGDKVTKGAPIAVMGTTGYSTGNHLHFEIALNGTRQDPEPFLTGTKKILEPGPTAAQVKSAIDRLVTKGLVNTPTYWYANYKQVEFLDLLFIRSADTLSRPGEILTSVDMALKRLVAKGVINTPEYWHNNHGKLEFLDELILRLGGAQ